jgi:hypothetical protein
MKSGVWKFPDSAFAKGWLPAFRPPKFGGLFHNISFLRTVNPNKFLGKVAVLLDCLMNSFGTPVKVRVEGADNMTFAYAAG